MAWEYLETEKYKARLLPIVEFLKGKTKDKTIIDIDCGTAPLLAELEPDWKTYFGNDIDNYFITKARGRNIPKTLFLTETDDKIILNHDILICLGYGAGQDTKQPLESSTLFDSIVRLSKFKPEIIIIEMILPFEEKFSCMGKFVTELKDYDYKETIVEIDDDFEYVRTRLIGFFTLKPS